MADRVHASVGGAGLRGGQVMPRTALHPCGPGAARVGVMPLHACRHLLALKVKVGALPATPADLMQACCTNPSPHAPPSFATAAAAAAWPVLRACHYMLGC